MKTFQTIAPENFDRSPFKMIGKDWMLITAENAGKVNSMTASWGGLGIMWNRNVVFAVVRKSRYTHEILEKASTFSLSFFDNHEQYRDILNYMGKASGRDEDKVQKSGLHILRQAETPYIAEASVAILCTKLCRQPISPENFLNDSLDKNYYPTQDYHDLYIGEILNILVQNPS